MPHILALHLELANFVLPPNSIPQRQRSLQSRDSKICAGVCWGRASAPSANVLCEVLFTLLALLCGGMPPLPP